jgi:hypothetical protein
MGSGLAVGTKLNVGTHASVLWWNMTIDNPNVLCIFQNARRKDFERFSMIK